MSENNSENNINDTGISVLIDILNDGKFDIIYDFNKPDEETLKAFALFLTLLERGTLYSFFLKKIKKLLEQKDSQIEENLEKIFTYKKEMDSNIDTPAILPRDVFKR